LDCTTTSKPCFINRSTVLGVAATRDSLGNNSNGIPTFMQRLDFVTALLSAIIHRTHFRLQCLFITSYFKKLFVYSRPFLGGDKTLSH